MAYDRSSITEVRHARVRRDFVVSWTSTAPAGTVFQVYLARKLAWAGTSRRCRLPWPSTRGPHVQVSVGVVPSADRATDFSASLPTLPQGRVPLSWFGGTYLSASIVGFHVYMGTVPGGAVDYATPVATVPAYPGGIILDGFGMGRFGKGSFGLADSSYAWTSPSLAAGTWNFAVVPFDDAGNEGTPITASQAVAAPPQPPAPDSRGVRLSYTYDSVGHTVTLNWPASP